jgi:hypothetical protein
MAVLLFVHSISKETLQSPQETDSQTKVWSEDLLINEKLAATVIMHIVV